MELNPNHSVTQSVHDQWHKICALLLFQSGKADVTIDATTVEAFCNSDLCNIVLRADERGLHLSLASTSEAADLARKEGGLPT